MEVPIASPSTNPYYETIGHEMASTASVPRSITACASHPISEWREGLE